MKKTRVAAYCRVSTDFQDQLHSLSAQIKFFTEYISERDDWELVEIYYDEGITGTSTKKREGFNRMIADCEVGKIDLIITKEVSRFARNTVDTLNYTRRLSELRIGVIFMNDGIDTRDKDGELRLTIMSSIAQEESRKLSERVKWGMKRKMEEGFVYGNKRIFGFTLDHGVLEIVPEEAEVVKRIFHMYLHEGKGTTRIASELNADGLYTVRGKIWRQDAVIRILKNDKYCGNLTQWKHYCTDYLTKKVKPNHNEDPDAPLITVRNHHEPIISEEEFNAANALLMKRGENAREGRKYSQHYWYSSRIYCGKCGWAFGVTGQKDNKNRCLRCVNRSKYGTEKRVDSYGNETGCDNPFISENMLKACMKHILEHIQSQRSEIADELLSDIMLMQQNTPAADTKPLQDKIDSLVSKKHKAIDMMLEDLISKDDLKKQVEMYDDEIEQLTAELTASKNIDALHQSQLECIRGFIEQVNRTDSIDTDNTEIYGEMLEKAVIRGEGSADFYLTCVPFGFHIDYHMKRIPKTQKFAVIIDNCEAKI